MSDPHEVCPVCGGEGRVYRMTAAYEAMSAQASGSFGWTGPTHEWRTCRVCGGRGLAAPAVTETDLRARIAAIPGETFGSGSDRWLRESSVIAALAAPAVTETADLRRRLETMFYPYRSSGPTTDFDRGVDAVLDAIEHNPHLLAAPAVTETADPDQPHIPQPSDICSVCGNGLVHIDAHRDAPAVTEKDEILDKVAAAVDGLGLYPAATPAGPRTPEQDGYNRATDDVLAAIERIRRGDEHPGG